MTPEEAERALAAAGAASEADFPLLEAAIACALHDDPDRDPEPARAMAADAGQRLKGRLERESPEEALAETLAGDLRLAGDLISYDDLANADIISVCQRRRGLPVALGVLYLDAARRCGVAAEGVDFPGHFLLRVETEEGPLAIDPFSGGRVVLPSELSRRALLAGLTPDVAARLEPAVDREAAFLPGAAVLREARLRGLWLRPRATGHHRTRAGGAAPGPGRVAASSRASRRGGAAAGRACECDAGGLGPGEAADLCSRASLEDQPPRARGRQHSNGADQASGSSSGPSLR